MHKAPKYPRHGAFRKDLNQRVDAYFEDRKLARTGGHRFLIKALIIASWFVISYLAMLLWSEGWWSRVLWALSLGLAHAGIGFSIMHDGGHGAAFARPWASRLAAYSLDMIGGSSRLWAFKHNVIHHQYPNVDGVDHDIVVQPWLRLTQSQRRRGFHIAQHLYFPLAYAFLTGKWLLHDDYRTLIRGRLGDVPTPPMKRAEVMKILAFKVFALGWALVLPIAVLGLWWGLGLFAIMVAVSGLVLASVFQLAHSVDSTELSPTPAPGERLPRTWAEQQVASTCNFAPDNRLLGWYVGGLNFQVEHHLFPRVSHVHYPAIAPIVREACRAHGIPYRSQETLGDAFRSHQRHLRDLGRAPSWCESAAGESPPAAPAG